MNHQREEWLYSLVGIVLLVGLIVPLTSAYGGLGAAWAMVISELITTGLTWWRVKHHLPNLKLKQYRNRSSLVVQPVDHIREATSTTPQQIHGNRPNPIFIVGAPRSGTSLLRIMLNRHPAIGICDETYYFYYVYTRRNAFRDLSDPTARRRLVESYLATRRIKKLGLNLDSLSEILLREGSSYEAFFVSLMRSYAMDQGKTRYGEKTPQHTLFSETLCEWYPDCKLIHLVRDPRDVVASLLRMPWASNSMLANTRVWLNCAQSAERCRYRDNYLLVRYEQLVSEPEAELTRICTFLGETYFPAMLIANEPTPADEWWFQRAKGPLSKDRLGKWREELTPRQVALIEWVAGTYMQQFGYEPSGEPAASLITRANALGDEFLDSVRQKFIKLPRMWYYWLQPTHLAREEAWIDGRM